MRPTTDFAKESLFNILNNKVDLDGLEVLDLFCGTGNISFEFASRNCSVDAVDQNINGLRFVLNTAKELKLNIKTTKSDVFKYLKAMPKKYDIVFADPPYDLENIPQIHELVTQHDILKDNGWLIIEHGPKTDLSNLNNFYEHRKYGNVNFSFFTNSKM